MAAGRLRPRDPTPGAGRQHPGRRRGSVTMTKPLPRFVVCKQLKTARPRSIGRCRAIIVAWAAPLHRDADTTLGSDYNAACGADGQSGKACTLNGLFDEWDAQRRGLPIEDRRVIIGTVDWPSLAYKNSNAWKRKVAARSRPDYERVMRLLCETLDKKGNRTGGLCQANRGARTCRNPQAPRLPPASGS